MLRRFSAAQLAALSPKVIGSAWRPTVRPIIDMLGDDVLPETSTT